MDNSNKPAETIQEDKKKHKVRGGASCTIFSPETGIPLTTPFDISGSSNCKDVVITIFDCDTNAILFQPKDPIPVTNNFFTYTFNDSTVHCSNAGILISCAEDASKFTVITGLSINSSSKKFHGKRHDINSPLLLKLDTYDDQGVKKLLCYVKHDNSKNIDVFFVRFIQFEDYKATHKKVKVDGKAKEKGASGGYNVKSDKIVKSGEVYVAHVVYSDDTDVFCSFVAKLFT